MLLISWIEQQLLTNSSPARNQIAPTLDVFQEKASRVGY